MLDEAVIVDEFTGAVLVELGLDEIDELARGHGVQLDATGWHVQSPN
jgi:hypothetical protein